MAIYAVSLKSQETRGATQPNIIKIGLADADVSDFVANCNHVIKGEVATVDKFLSHDYSLPYPAGTGLHLRFAMWDAMGRTEQMRLQNVNTDVDVAGLCSSLLAAGIRLPKYDSAAVRVNAYFINPGPTVQSGP